MHSIIKSYLQLVVKVRSNIQYTHNIPSNKDESKIIFEVIRGRWLLECVSPAVLFSVFLCAMLVYYQHLVYPQ
jgi:hypothetical protein